MKHFFIVLIISLCIKDPRAQIIHKNPVEILKNMQQPTLNK